MENRIEPNADLINLFHGYWKALVPESIKPRLYMPFYHLKNERSGIWALHHMPGFLESIPRGGSPTSLSHLMKYNVWGMINDNVYQRWRQAETRLIDHHLVISHYFPYAVLPISPMLPLDLLEEQIIHLSREQYVAEQFQDHVFSDEKEELQVMRGEAFKRTIPRMYRYRCAITGLQVQNERGVKLIDACHIKPWAESYDDTVTNGIALSPTLHRAFDRGLISIAKDYTVLVTPDLQESESAHAIRPYDGMRLYLPNDLGYLPAQDNLEWHRKRWGFGT